MDVSIGNDFVRKNKLNNHKDQTPDFSHLSYAKPQTTKYEKSHDANDKNKSSIDRVGYEYDNYDYYEDNFTKTDLSVSSTTESNNDEYYYYNDHNDDIDGKSKEDPEYEYFYYYTYEYVDPEELQSAQNVEKLPKPSYYQKEEKVKDTSETVQ